MKTPTLCLLTILLALAASVPDALDCHRERGAVLPVPTVVETTLDNPHASLTITRIVEDRVPMTLIAGGIPGTRRADRRIGVPQFVSQSGAQAGLNGTFFANAALRGRDCQLIGPTLCGDAQFLRGVDDRAALVVGRPLVLMSPDKTRIFAYNPATMDDGLALRRLLPGLSDAFLGGVWLVHNGQAATAAQLAQYHVNDSEDVRRRAFFFLEPDGRPGIGATTDVTPSHRLAHALQDAGVQEAVLLDSGFSTSLVYGHRIIVTGHTAPGLPSRPVPHAVVLFAARTPPPILHAPTRFASGILGHHA